MQAKIKKILRVSFIGTNAMAIILYLLACLVPWLNEGHFTFIALLGLVFPLLFLALLVFLIYWIFRKSKWALVCAVSLLLGWQQVSVMFGFNANKKFEVTKNAQTIRVLTWNLSSWGETNKATNTYHDYRKEMVDLIRSAQPDVICLQEYKFTKEINFRDSIIPELTEQGYNYAYFVKTKYITHLYKSAHVTGVAIVSKYPISDKAHFYYDEDDFAEPLMYADVKFNDKTIRFFTTHLQSVRFEHYDYEALHNLKEPAGASVTQARGLAWKLRQAYKKRAMQANLLHQKIIASPYPVVVCGDFNDVPNSYTYFTVKGNLQDVFLKKGSGFGRTFRFISPTLRIDYILADKKFSVKQFNEYRVNYSDHYPVVADLDLDEK